MAKKKIVKKPIDLMAMDIGPPPYRCPFIIPVTRRRSAFSHFISRKRNIAPTPDVGNQDNVHGTQIQNGVYDFSLQFVEKWCVGHL